MILISSWYFSPVFTGEISLSKNDKSCFSKWICCARGHYSQLPALLNSSLHFILICKFLSCCKVMKRDSAMETDSSSQDPGGLFSSILPLTVFVVLEKSINVAQFWKMNWTSWWKKSISVTGWQPEENSYKGKKLLVLEGFLGGSLESCREAVKVGITGIRDAGISRLWEDTLSKQRKYVAFLFVLSF